MSTEERTVQEDGRIIIKYTDNASAFGGIKQAKVKDKGRYNCTISAAVFQLLSSRGIPNVFIKKISDREQLCRKTEPIPLEFIVRNRLAGTTAEMLGVENGTRIHNTVYEIRLANPELGKPRINSHHAVALGLASYTELDSILGVLEKTNGILKDFFARAGIELVDFKTKFGRTEEGALLISSEITPDNTRLWDINTGEILDKDRFRHDYGDVSASYKVVAERISKLEL